MMRNAEPRIVEGAFDMDFRDRTIIVGPGQMLLVPRDVDTATTAIELA